MAEVSQNKHLVKVSFGWIVGKARWGMTDNLVITVYDRERSTYWRCDQRLVRVILRTASKPRFRKHDPLTYARIVFDKIDRTFWPDISAKYVGSIHATENVKSSRHFVLVEVQAITNKLQSGLNCFQINPDCDLVPQLGHYQAPIVGEIIRNHQATILSPDEAVARAIQAA